MTCFSEALIKKCMKFARKNPVFKSPFGDRGGPQSSLNCSAVQKHHCLGFTRILISNEPKYMCQKVFLSHTLWSFNIFTLGSSMHHEAGKMTSSQMKSASLPCVFLQVVHE